MNCSQRCTIASPYAWSISIRYAPRPCRSAAISVEPEDRQAQPRVAQRAKLHPQQLRVSGRDGPGRVVRNAVDPRQLGGEHRSQGTPPAAPSGGTTARGQDPPSGGSPAQRPGTADERGDLATPAVPAAARAARLVPTYSKWGWRARPSPALGRPVESCASHCASRCLRALRKPRVFQAKRKSGRGFDSPRLHCSRCAHANAPGRNALHVATLREMLGSCDHAIRSSVRSGADACCVA